MSEYLVNNQNNFMEILYEILLWLGVGALVVVALDVLYIILILIKDWFKNL